MSNKVLSVLELCKNYVPELGTAIATVTVEPRFQPRSSERCLASPNTPRITLELPRFHTSNQQCHVVGKFGEKRFSFGQGTKVHKVTPK